MRPLRIGIACYPTYGGSGVLATELGQALARRGHEIHLFSYARPGRLSYCHGVEFHNVTVSSYPLFHYPPYDLALASILRQVMAARSLDIVHVHYAVPHAICAYLAKQMCSSCATKIVTTLHGTDITILGRDPAYRDVIRFGLRESDAVISVSTWLEQQTREAFSYEGPIHVVPNFVDQGRFRPRGDRALRADLGGAEGRPLVVHMSNFRALKRTRDTVEVLRRLDPALGAVLVLVGDGPDLTLVREDAARLGLTDRIRFLGEIDNVESVIAAADVALFPSESESFGLAPLEAMACSVPVVTTTAGGLPEVVDPSCGFLHEIGDTAGMARSVGALLADDTLRHRMGQAALAKASERFSLEASLQRHEALYADLLGLAS